MDPPSQQLIERLRELRLCRPGDVRRCRRLVRRLARDLPTFDSVWIDALVQTRRLTPFQARLLDSPDPGRLSVGPFVLIDRLGDDGRLARYLARETDGRTRYLLSRASCYGDHPSAALDRVQQVIRSAAGLQDPSLSPIVGCALQDGLVTAVSRHVPGPTLTELLVRRGCFPPGIVQDIASQLSGALAALESAQVVHGDLRLRNVVLSRGGRAVLLHAGLLAAVDPELTIHADFPPDAYDTVAPERIGSGLAASTSSDMYALGCLLFELIAGRPPFLHGDPLAKLAAHQTQAVPDVRRFAPETPDGIADLLAWLTDKDPRQRPESFAELSRQLKRRGTRGRLKRFAAAFQHPVRIRRPPLRTPRLRRMVVPLLMLFGVANLALLHAGARTELLSIADSFSRRIRDAVRPDAPAIISSQDAADERALSPFPTEVIDGVLTLDGPGPFAAGRLAAVGPLVVRGDPAQRPVIVIQDEPLELWGEQIVLENLIVEGRGLEATSLVEANCQRIGLRNCVFRGREGAPVAAAVEWTALDESSASSPRVAAVQTLFVETGASLRFHSVPETVRTQDVLLLGGGALIEFAGATWTARPIDVTLQQTTLRASRGVVRMTAGTGPVVLTLEDSAVDLDPDRSALILFDGPPPADWSARVRVTGQDSLVRPGTTLAAVDADPGARMVPLEAGGLSVDGLFAAEFSFAGEDPLDPAGAVVSGPPLFGHSLTPPGADVAAFTPDPPGAYNSSE